MGRGDILNYVSSMNNLSALITRNVLCSIYLFLPTLSVPSQHPKCKLKCANGEKLIQYSKYEQFALIKLQLFSLVLYIINMTFYHKQMAEKRPRDREKGLIPSFAWKMKSSKEHFTVSESTGFWEGISKSRGDVGVFNAQLETFKSVAWFIH